MNVNLCRLDASPLVSTHRNVEIQRTTGPNGRSPSEAQNVNNRRSSSLIYVALHPAGSGGGGSFVSDLLLHSSACDAAPSAGPAVTHELRHRQRH